MWSKCHSLSSVVRRPQIFFFHTNPWILNPQTWRSTNIELLIYKGLQGQPLQFLQANIYGEKYIKEFGIKSYAIVYKQ